MIQFAEQFSDFTIVVTLSRQLSWSHFLVLIPSKKELEQKINSILIETRERMQRQKLIE